MNKKNGLQLVKAGQLYPPPPISLEIVEQAKYMSALRAQSLHIKMRDAENKESESQFSC